jgi:hypothetical protein
MDEAGYQRYLRENGKQEIGHYDVKLTDPAGAHRKLEQLMADKWFWKGLPDNCATFAVQIIRAGGGNLDILLNCPNQDFVKQLRKDLENGLKGLGAAPRVGFF